MTTRQTPDAVREAIVAAITKADADFGYSYRLTKMDDTGEEHTLFMNGFEPTVFQDRGDGYPVIEQRRNAARTDAILAALDSRAGDAGEGWNWPEPKFVPVESGAKLNPERVEAAFQLINGELVIGEQFQLIGMMLDGTDYIVVPATPAPAVDAVPAGENMDDADIIKFANRFYDPNDSGYGADTRKWIKAVRAALSHGEGRK